MSLLENNTAASNDTKLTRTRVCVTVPTKGRNPRKMQKKAYALIIDVAQYPEYMDSVDSLDVLEREEDRLVTRWDAQIDGAPIQWVQVLLPRKDDLVMDFEAVEGDFDVFRGQWRVDAAGNEIHLNLTVEYRLGIPVIGEVLGPILREKVEANCRAMLGAIAGQLQVNTGS